MYRSSRLERRRRRPLVFRKPYRAFSCPVVSEEVIIALRRPPRFGQQYAEYFVQCNQVDCQYVRENKPPCPLNLEMFAAELAERKQNGHRAPGV